MAEPLILVFDTNFKRFVTLFLPGCIFRMSVSATEKIDLNVFFTKKIIKIVLTGMEVIDRYLAIY